MTRFVWAATAALLLLAPPAVRATTIGAIAVPAPSPSPSASPGPIGNVTARRTDGVLPQPGLWRIGDALATVPGIAPIGQGSSVSTDLFLSVRGFKPTETLTLLDGHPIGPLGVSPDMAAGFDYQNAPLFALQRAIVLFGSGPAGPYAFDTVDGSIDFQTLESTPATRVNLAQTAGEQARSSSFIAATGTAGAIGFVLAGSVQGTSGNFTPQTIAQTGLRGTDFTTPTLQALTYPVSANALARNALAKAAVPLGRATTLTLSSFSATSWIDKTGVDDNDFYPYAFELFQAQRDLGGSLTSGGAHCPSALVPVIDHAHPNAAQPNCLTPQAFAAGASGPAGGGPGAYQTMRQADDALQVVTHAGGQTITVDGFVDAQTTALVRPASFVQTDADTNVAQYATNGFSARDAFVLGPLRLDAGVSSVRQFVQTSDMLVDAGVPTLTQANAELGETNAFLYLSASPVARLDVAANLLVKQFDALAQRAIDPQVVLAYRPTMRDVVRLLAGAASAEPAASARGGVTTFTSAGDLDPGNCSTFTIGTAPNANVTSERASDAELAYGHQFAGVSVGASAYVTSERNAIFGAGTPLAALGGFTVTSPGLAGFYDRVRSICPGAYGGATDAQIFSSLNVLQPLNAARALSRGAVLRAGVRLGRTITMDATYTIDSARRFDLPAAVLALPSNATIVDGGQVANVPVHEASVVFTHASARGISADLAAYYQGPNNALNRPGYAYADVAVHAPVGHALRLDLAVTNAFNSHVDTYGRVGLGLFVPENPYGTDTSALEQATERYGLAPATLVLTLTQRIGS